jgi:hypothetical protein
MAANFGPVTHQLFTLHEPKFQIAHELVRSLGFFAVQSSELKPPLLLLCEPAHLVRGVDQNRLYLGGELRSIPDKCHRRSSLCPATYFLRGASTAMQGLVDGV